MKRYRKETIPEQQVDRFEAIVCDICGAESSKNIHEWWGDRFEGVEIEIKYNSASRYPDDVSGDVIEYDLCPDCFRSKLMPWMESQGTKPSEYDY